MVILAALLLAASGAGGLSWQSPAAWPAEPHSSPMRVGTHRVAPAAGDSEPAELAIFFFGPEGGTVQANVDRWFAQFMPESGSAQPASRTETINGVRVTRVSTEGIFASGMPGQATTPKRSFALLGAIAEGPQGNVFFKLIGPRKTVHAAASQFEKLLHTLARQ